MGLAPGRELWGLLVFRKANIEPVLLEIVNHRLDVRGYLAL